MTFTPFRPLVPVCLIFALSSVLSCSKHGSSPSSTGTTPPADSVSKTPASIPDTLYSWQKIDSLPGINVDDIWFTSPTNGFLATVTSSTSGGIYQTTDGGKSWSINVSGNGDAYLNLFFVDNLYGFVQGPSQMAVTTDGGSTWSLRTMPAGSANHGFMEYFTSRSTGYVTCDNGNIYKTNDTANTWTQLTSETPGSSDCPYFLTGDKGFLYSNSGVFASTSDGGASWHPQSNQFNLNLNGVYTSLQFLDSLTGYYGFYTGVAKTTDGGHTWSQVFSKASRVSVIKFFDANLGYFKADSAVYKTTDGGQTWALSCRVGSGLLIGMHFVDSTHGWICTKNGYIYRITE